MEEMRNKIMEQLCYTELVYGRINKKLKSNLEKVLIERKILDLVSDKKNQIVKRGKNFYISDTSAKIRVTVNSNTYRVITVDKI